MELDIQHQPFTDHRFRSLKGRNIKVKWYKVMRTRQFSALDSRRVPVAKHLVENEIMFKCKYRAEFVSE